MEDCKEQEAGMDNNVTLVPFERPAVIEKLTSNMGKRKSSTPQKFVGKLQMSTFVVCSKKGSLWLNPKLLNALIGNFSMGVNQLGEGEMR